MQEVTKIRTLIVDDESASRRKLKQVLSLLPNIEIIDVAENGRQAKEKIEKSKPDLVFLDIEMPIMTGIEVALATADYSYQLIFLTAYEHYAVKAFETHAIDYLLKPITKKRLEKALNKAFQHKQTLNHEKIDALRRLNCHEENQTHISVRRGNANVVLNAHDIAFLEAISGYCRIHLNRIGQESHGIDTLLTDNSLSNMQEQLPQTTFVRVHRAFSININQILRYFVNGRRMFIRLRDFPSQDIPVSRMNEATIRKRWLNV